MIELNKIYNQDCLEGMKFIDDKSIDMILCDLPYGTTACKWDSIIPFEPLWEQYERIIKDNGVIVLFGSEPFSSILRMSNIKNYKYDWYWIKEKGKGQLNAKKMPLKSVETISVFYKKPPIYNPQFLNGKPYNKLNCNKNNLNKGVYGNMNVSMDTVNSGYRYPKTDIYFTSVQRTIHPTQKPVELCEYFINTYTNEGSLILDNCIGSGTTAEACIRTNRNFIGFDNGKDDKTGRWWVDIANDRIKNIK